MKKKVTQEARLKSIFKRNNLFAKFKFETLSSLRFISLTLFFINYEVLLYYINSTILLLNKKRTKKKKKFIKKKHKIFSKELHTPPPNP